MLLTYIAHCWWQTFGAAADDVIISNVGRAVAIHPPWKEGFQGRGCCAALGWLIGLVEYVGVMVLGIM